MAISGSDNESRPHSSAVVHKANGHGAPPESESDLTEDDTPLSQAVVKSSPVVARTSNKRKKLVLTDSSGEDIPLASSPAKQLASAAVPMPGALEATTVPPRLNGRGKATSPVRHESDSDDSDVDTKKKKKKVAPRPAPSKPPRKKVKKEEPDSDDDADFADAPKPPKKAAATRKRKVKPESSDEEAGGPPKKTAKPRAKKVKAEHASEPPATPQKKKGKAKKADDADEVDGSPSKAAKKKEEEEEEDMYRWWEAEGEADGSTKWKTLTHNGVLFPPPYETLPASVKMKYNGKPLDLPPASEEVAGFYGAMIMTEHAQDATFNKNFFADWKKVLKDHPPRDGAKVASFDLCDFRPMYEYFEAEKAKKKAMTAAQKKEAKKIRDELEAPYKTCLMDGRKETVGNFRVEPPGLFRGRGDHPRKGALKFRVAPEDITLNIQKGVPVPKPNVPGEWGRVQNNDTVTWLANWTENVNQNHKYVFLAAGSALKGQSDMKKFEKARELKKHIDRIRQNYRNDLNSKVMADRQRATAMYFIDKLALRAGNEKGEDEADTVGCCSLRCEHITLRQPNILVFDFLGKDSIRYYKEVEVEPQIFKNIRIFKSNKDDGDNLFDRVNTGLLNKHLANEMKGLTAKVFRTYNASSTFQDLLDKEDLTGKTIQEKLNAYNKANRLVAILCNHHRTVSKTHGDSMNKLTHKLRGLKYDRMKLRHALFQSDSKYKKQAKYKEDESDVDDDFIEQWEEERKTAEIEKAQKKFAKDNEKRVADGEKELKPSELKEKLDAIEDDFKALVKERGTGKATQKGREKTDEKLMEMIDKLDERIRTSKLQMVDREEGKEVALGTSKINYLDPRITSAWCKTNTVPVEKIFSKSLLTKFPWALEADGDWKF